MTTQTRFAAPWSTFLKATTLLVCVLLIGMAAMGVLNLGKMPPGAAIAISASANIAEAGAAVIFKNCFIFVFLVLTASPFNRIGGPELPRNRRCEIATPFSFGVRRQWKRRASPLI